MVLVSHLAVIWFCMQTTCSYTDLSQVVMTILVTYLQVDINAVSEWVDANLLQSNVKKKVMKISRKKQGVSGPTQDLKLHNQTLQHVDVYKYRGPWTIDLPRSLMVRAHTDHVQ